MDPLEMVCLVCLKTYPRPATALKLAADNLAVPHTVATASAGTQAPLVALFGLMPRS